MKKATVSTTELSNDEYRKIKAWSKSDLDSLNESPAVYEWIRNSGYSSSDSVDLGTHLHCAVLEPEVFEEVYRVSLDFGKTEFERVRKEEYHRRMKEYGNIALDESVMDMVLDMKKSIMNHPVAKRLLTSKGKSEVSMFSEIQGMPVKCRPDRIPDHNLFGHIVVDLKKTADIDKFDSSVLSFRYDVQAAIYSDIYFNYTGFLPRFVFVVVAEKRSMGRHPVRVWELPADVVDEGRLKYLADLEAAREYDSFGCGMDIPTLKINRYKK